jgi:hypothetical protein
MDNHQERELRAEFEAWAASRHKNLAREGCGYVDDAAHEAWLGFAAGRRSSPSTQRLGEMQGCGKCPRTTHYGPGTCAACLAAHPGDAAEGKEG